MPINKLLQKLGIVLILGGMTIPIQNAQAQLTHFSLPKKIAPDDLREGDSYGFSLAVKNDYGMIAAPYQDTSNMDAGAVYLFDLKYNKLVKKLTAPEEAEGDLFGYSVALSEKHAVISQPYRDTLGADSGAAYIYSLDELQEPSQLKAEDIKAGDLFGFAVTVSDKYAVVSAPYKDEGEVDTGVVYVFDIMTGTLLWKLIPTDGKEGDLFGYTVAIAENNLLVGVPYRDEQGIDSGVVYRFDLETGKELAKLVPEDGGAGDLFGFALTVNEPEQLLVGAPYDDTRGIDSGSVYLFDYNTNIELNNFSPEDSKEGDVHGHSLAMFNDKVLVGAIYLDNGDIPDTGGAYFFDPNDYETLVKITHSQLKTGDLMGYAVGGHEDFALIGAPHTDDYGEDSGMVYLIKRR
jgi:outer membrane protein assembly factor BamB